MKEAQAGIEATMIATFNSAMLVTFSEAIFLGNWVTWACLP